MSKKFAKKLTEQQANKLLREIPNRNDEEFENLMPRSKGYALQNGQLITKTPTGSYMLWESRQDCLDGLRETFAAKPEHVLHGIFKADGEFPSTVDDRIRYLARRFDLPVESLSKSVASLELVDEAIRKYGQRKALKSPIFEAIVAYVGEVIRSVTKGEWDMKLDSDGKTWEPWIVDQAGRRYSPFMVVYKELDSDEGFSIWGATDGEITSK